MMDHSTVPELLSGSCQVRIEKMMSEHSFFTGVLISTRDGFHIASKLRSDIIPNKLAAMSSSLLSVAEALAQGGHVGVPRNAVVEADDGRALLMEIRTPEYELVFTAFCVPNANLGKALWPVRECAKDIAQAIADIR